MSIFNESNDNNTQQIHDPFANQTLSHNNCFLCGVLLNSDNRAEEHVYPKWLQNKFNLWNKTIHLLNGTLIKYKSLYIPCCKECNNLLNITLEIPIKQAVDEGYDKFIKLDEKIIFQWLVKLSYGLLFKELSLKLNLRDSSSDTIVEADWLTELYSLHTFLQTIRFGTRFFGCNPWSILIFKVHINEKYENYNAQDFIVTSNFFMQLNDIGIIANLHDNGYNKNMFLHYNKGLLEREIHPIQFAEIRAQFFYKCTLFNRIPKYTISWMKENVKNSFILSHEIVGDAYDDWDSKKYAEYLVWFLKSWGAELDKMVDSEGRVMTFLYNEDGSFKTLDQFTD